jgi:ribose transport system ATP-binding protein
MADASQKIKTRFKQALVFSLVLIVAASLLSLVLLLQSMRDEQSLTQLRFRREEVLQNYMEAMLNQETGLRGYIASDPTDEKFLTAYRTGQKQYAVAQHSARSITAQAGQAGFRDVVQPLEAQAEDWQQMAQNAIAVIHNHDKVDATVDLNARSPRIAEFDAFRKTFHAARILNERQVEAQEQERASAWILAEVFALGVMGTGIGAAILAGQRAARTIGAQATQLVDQAERLSAQNEVLQTQQTELQARNRELQLIGRLTSIAASELRLDAVREAFRGVLGELIPFDRCTIFLLDTARAQARVVLIEGVEVPGWEDGSAHPVQDTLMGKALATGRPLSVADLAQLEAEDTRREHAQELAEIGIQAFVLTPLIAHGVVIGSLNFYSETAGRYDAHTLGLIEQVAGRIASALENSRLFEEERLKSQLLAVSVQETHHRVKNNLQAVSALLDMQLMESGDLVSRDVLERTITQIRAISLVHDMLSHEGEAEVVNVKQVVEKMLPLVTLAYRDVTLQMDLTPMVLPMRRMTSLALVINELALNALKHCVEGSCHITVRSWCDAAQGRAYLTIQDTGPGFPSDFDPARHANLGLQLVTTLVDNDLNGTITFENRGGAYVEIAFPLKAPPATERAHAATVGNGVAAAETPVAI